MCVLGDNKRERETRLMRSGSLIKQRALQRGSLMVAPCLSSWVANPPSITAQPPALFIRSSNNVIAFWKPISPWSSLSLSLDIGFTRTRTPWQKYLMAPVTEEGGSLLAFCFFLNADEIAYRFTFYFFKKRKQNPWAWSSKVFLFYFFLLLFQISALI